MKGLGRMKDFDRHSQRIYLYSHDPEAEKALNNGQAAISTGGIRRSDGTMLDMANPLSFTLDELKDMFADDKKLVDTEIKVSELENAMLDSQNRLQLLMDLRWSGNAVLNQIQSMSYEGFRRTISGLEYISANMDEFRQYVLQRDFGDIKEKMELFSSYLELDMQRLELSNLSIVNSDIGEHLNKIGQFIKRMYEGLIGETEDGFLAVEIMNALLSPFTCVLKKYMVLFYYENGVSVRFCDKWVNLIYDISHDSYFKEKIMYYIDLESDCSYRKKIESERKYVGQIEGIYNSVRFDLDYSLYHKKEEYLDMPKTIQRILSSEELIPEDGNIYL